MEVFLVDGTYELFRHYYALPSARDQNGCEVGAVRGVLASVLGMIKDGATHVGVATDHDARVDRIIICTPDKDLAQCVRGTRVVQLNRRTRITCDEAGVIQKFGVRPASIPDYLA